MFDLLTEPLGFAFMQRAFLAASLAAVVCAAVGTFVVLKGLAFMGDAVAHSSLAGMALVYALGGSILLGALAWVVPASLVITYVSRRANVMLDTSIGIIYAGGFALGIIILSQVNNYTVDLFGFLFGNVLGATWGDIIIIGAVAAAVLLVMAILYKEILFTSYDSTMAEVSGVPVRLVQYLMPLLIGVTTVVALKTVGIVLVLALLVTPAATARLLVRRLPLMMATSVLVALAATVVGLYLSFYLDLASGPTIVLVATGIFALVLMVSPSTGVVWRRRSREAISTSVGA